jgi:hypothetical protein
MSGLEFWLGILPVEERWYCLEFMGDSPTLIFRIIYTLYEYFSLLDRMMVSSALAVE